MEHGFKRTGPKVNGETEGRTAEPSPCRAAKLERHLRLGKVLLGRPDAYAVDGNGRKVSTLVSLERPAEDRFVVRVERYYTSDDVGSLSDEEFVFGTLGEAAAFIARKTGVLFHRMYIKTPLGKNRVQ